MEESHAGLPRAAVGPGIKSLYAYPNMSGPAKNLYIKS